MPARQPTTEDSSDTSSCRGDVRATSTPIGFSHLFLVYTNEHGNQYGYRAGPSLPAGFGDIERDYGSYAPDTFPDYDSRLPERERVGLGAGLLECDLQRALANLVTLAHELIEAAVLEQAVPVLVDVPAV